MYQKSKREDDLFSGTKQKKDKKKHKQKEKNTPPTLPDPTGVHRCQYDHSQQLMLVVMSRNYTYTLHNVRYNII